MTCVPSPRHPAGGPDRPAVPRRPVRVSRRGQHGFRDGRQLQRQRPAFRTGLPPRGAVTSSRCISTGPMSRTLTYRVSFAEPDADGRQPLAAARPDRRATRARTPPPASSCWQAGPARRPAGRDPAVGRADQRTAFYIDLSLLAHRQRGGRLTARARTCPDWRPGTRPRTASPAPPSTRSCCEVSHQHPLLRPGARIGVWAATKLATDAGGWRQINRAGHPMMWPIFWPDDTEFTNPANTRHPSEGRQHRGEVHRRAGRRARRGQRNRSDPQGYGAGRGPANCSPTCCSYIVGTPGRSTGSPPATAGPWPTTLPRRCCRWSRNRRCPPGSNRPPMRASAPVLPLRRAGLTIVRSRGTSPEVGAEVAHQGGDLRGQAPPGVRPVVHPIPPVLARGPGVPRQQMDVQVSHAVTDHGRVDVLGPGYVAQRPAGPGAPPAHPLRFGVGEVGQARCMPAWLHEQMPQVDRAASAARSVGGQV